MNNRKLLIGGIVALIILVIVVIGFYLTRSSKPDTLIDQSEPTHNQNYDYPPSNQESSNPSINNFNEINETNLYSQVDISILAPNENISAFSLRLSLTDPEKQYPDPSIILNQNLISSNWTYPIKTVYRSGDQIIIDIAGVNLSSGGFYIDQELNIASLDFAGQNITSNQLTFDPNQTKTVRKDGSEIPFTTTYGSSMKLIWK